MKLVLCDHPTSAHSPRGMAASLPKRFSELVEEGLDGVNRQPSKGLKLNRQPSKKVIFDPQPVKNADR